VNRHPKLTNNNGAYFDADQHRVPGPPCVVFWERWRANFRKRVRLDQELVKLPKLIALIRDRSKGAKHSLCKGRMTDSIGHGQNSLPNPRCDTKDTHDLGHSATGEVLAAGDVRLVSAL
jgi:hypothetical protein